MAGRPGAGPALALSLVLVAIVCAFTGLCYAEMASMIPIAGSAYTYTYATMGELVAWIIGWDLILEYAFSNMSVSVGLSRTYCRSAGLVRFPSSRHSGYRPHICPPAYRIWRGYDIYGLGMALRLQHSGFPRGHAPDRHPGARHPGIGPHQQYPGP